ncbi:hypothetical protein Ancab_040133 [Ancistrocladus abbreviatus]
MAFLNSSTDHETQLSEEEAFLQALNTSSSLLFAMSFRSALELRLFEIIAKAGRGLSAEEIVAQLPTKNPEASNMLERMLCLLASYSFLSCTIVTTSDDGHSQRLYDLTPMAKFYAPNKDGASLANGFSVIHFKAMMDSWDKLTEAILEGGIPFHLANGVGMFEFAGRDPNFNKEFNISMTNQSALFMKGVMQSYKGFEHINQLVDVGGGVGSTLKIITSQYPHIKGINYDLPHVIQQATPSPGIEHIGGDMFQSVPSGEVIWMKWVLHICDDNHCIKLLKNCYKALPDNGKVIVIDTVIPEEPEKTSYAKHAYMSDVEMMVFNSAGKERTLKEFWSLANAAGFASVKLVCRVYFSDIMEFYK